jgi:hypothetical protein
MKIISLPDVLHQYLLQLIETHAARGIHPEEGMAVNRLWEAVSLRVTTIPDAEVEKAAAVIPPAESKVECEICFLEEGTTTCVRPAHQSPAHQNRAHAS